MFGDYFLVLASVLVLGRGSLDVSIIGPSSMVLLKQHESVNYYLLDYTNTETESNFTCVGVYSPRFRITKAKTDLNMVLVTESAGNHNTYEHNFDRIKEDIDHKYVASHSFPITLKGNGTIKCEVANTYPYYRRETSGVAITFYYFKPNLPGTEAQNSAEPSFTTSLITSEKDVTPATETQMQMSSGSLEVSMKGPTFEVSFKEHNMNYYQLEYTNNETVSNFTCVGVLKPPVINESRKYDFIMKLETKSTRNKKTYEHLFTGVKEDIDHKYIVKHSFSIILNGDGIITCTLSLLNKDDNEFTPKDGAAIVQYFLRPTPPSREAGSGSIHVSMKGPSSMVLVENTYFNESHYLLEYTEQWTESNFTCVGVFTPPIINVSRNYDFIMELEIGYKDILAYMFRGIEEQVDHKYIVHHSFPIRLIGQRRIRCTLSLVNTDYNVVRPKDGVAEVQLIYWPGDVKVYVSMIGPMVLFKHQWSQNYYQLDYTNNETASNFTCAGVFAPSAIMVPSPIYAFYIEVVTENPDNTSHTSYRTPGIKEDIHHKYIVNYSFPIILKGNGSVTCKIGLIQRDYFLMREHNPEDGVAKTFYYFKPTVGTEARMSSPARS